MKNLGSLFLVIAFPAVALAAPNGAVSSNDVVTTSDTTMEASPVTGSANTSGSALTGQNGDVMNGQSGATFNGSGGTTLNGQNGINSQTGVNKSRATMATSDAANANGKNLNDQIPTADLNLQKSIQMSLGNSNRFSNSLNGVKITANSGRVLLKGWVGSEEEKNAYTQQVERVMGVTSVDNQLQVKQ